MNSPILTEPQHPIVLQTPLTLPLKDRLSVRLYPDCRPNCLETALLQKGLVLMLDGKELIEEGVGWGVPVVKYEDKTYFSSTAQISIQNVNTDSCTITKTYVLDTVSHKKFGRTANIDSLYSPIRKTFEKLYLNNKKANLIFNKLMELRGLTNIKTEFTKKPSRGQITVTYRCQPSAIHIQADLSKIALSRCREILLLNEQGSGFFPKYVDSTGTTFFGNRIGAWDAISAKQASLQSLGGQLAFSLQSVAGANLFRGWERTKKRFSWAGISYSIRPDNGVFKYSISLDFKP